MKPFVFSADSHIVEPNDLYVSNLPAGLRKWALHVERGEDFIATKAGDQIVHRVRLSSNPEEKADLGRSKRSGAREIAPRLADMAADGIDAEICFPTLALMSYFVPDPEAELASAQIYNDWNHALLKDHLDRFVRCAVLPVRDLAATRAELERIAARGTTAAMIPAVTPANVPKYNNEAWDEIFARAGELGVVFVLHTGTGLESVIAERGPGGAVINYTRQMCDAIDSATYLVAGGLLDRHPQTKVAFIESGASWLAGLAERLDEVYDAHQYFVRPKLGRRPSQIIRDQVKASFQHDRACIMARGVTGTGALLWASDYPHMEGTFPDSREIVDRMFDGIDIGEDEKADIVGGNAARLFRLPSPAVELA